MWSFACFLDTSTIDACLHFVSFRFACFFRVRVAMHQPCRVVGVWPLDGATLPVGGRLFKNRGRAFESCVQAVYRRA